MTREEIIKGYTNNQKKSTWAQLGSNVITSDTKLYNKGMVYQVKVDNAPLFDCLVFCREDHIGGLDWTQGNIIDSFSGEISFGNNIIDPNLIVVMSKTDFDEADASAVPSDFVPFQETLSEDDGNIIINPDTYEQILSVLGYPYITEEELEYNRDEITRLVLKPCLETYYKFFPRRETHVYPATGSVQEYEYPSNAYAVVGWQVIQSGGSINGQGGEITNTLLRYADLVNSGLIYSMGGASSGYSTLTGNYINSMYPPKTSINTPGSYVLQRASMQAMINYNNRDKVDTVLKKDDEGHVKRFVRFYSNKIGASCEVTFGCKDNSFESVEFARKQELIKLCQAHLKLFFANLRSQAKPISGNIVDYKEWKQEATNDIKEVTELWQSLVKYSLPLRGNIG